VPTALDTLSKELDTEVIYLAFSSVCDSLQFTRSISGHNARHLQYGMQWEEVMGEQEAWEAAAFFSQDLLADTPLDDPDYARIAEIYDNTVIRAGENYPIVDARESARAAAIHYRLTDWLDDWHVNTSDQNSCAQPLVTTQPIVCATKPRLWWRFW
jgi:hypothetical protein